MTTTRPREKSDERGKFIRRYFIAFGKLFSTIYSKILNWSNNNNNNNNSLSHAIAVWMRRPREKSNERGKLIRRYFIVLGVDDGNSFREKSDERGKLIRRYFIVLGVDDGNSLCFRPQQ